MGYDRDVQYLHQLRFSRLQLPGDLWFGDSDSVQLGRSDQYVAGAALNLPVGLMFTAEFYYRKLYHVVDRQEGTSLFYIPDDPENYIFQGTGEAHGSEFTLERKEGKTSGRLS